MNKFMQGFSNIFSSLNPFRSKEPIDSWPRLSPENRQYYADTAEEAIKQDWLRVGNDMRRSMGQPILSFEECYEEYMDNN